jgi:hypothetical protein
VIDNYQSRVYAWMLACFGDRIANDAVERCDRFIEEAIELVQSLGYARARVLALVDYVYGRPQGDEKQEVGGVMVTLSALCTTHGINVEHEAERELARVWTKVEEIREKQKAKPTGSALPIAPDALPITAVGALSDDELYSVATGLMDEWRKRVRQSRGSVEAKNPDQVPPKVFDGKASPDRAQ